VFSKFTKINYSLIFWNEFCTTMVVISGDGEPLTSACNIACAPKINVARAYGP
jgi:hypothetical protein